MKKTKFCKTFSALLSLMLIFSNVIAYADDNTNTIYIKNEEDLKIFSGKCVSDAYSMGKNFVLAKDINLTDIDFVPVPIFCGSFNGNYHTISGFKLNEKGSNLGLFRYIEPQATVKNLTVEGVITPEGTREYIAILVGQNSGTIENCNVSGNVEGENNIGGICAVNNATGVIVNCNSSATLSASTNTGGIAGKNDGTIKNCKSFGFINILSDKSYTNTGGICGYNNGTVENCENHAKLGYKHSGYNTGGVVGLQCGIIIDCKNFGFIEGRKDIGGIAGQFEPDIILKYGENNGENLNNQIKILNNLVKEFSNESNHLFKISLTGIENINNSLNIVTETLTDSADYFSESTDNVKSKIKKEKRDIDKISNNMTNETNDFTDEVTGSIDDINSSLEKLKETLENGSAQEVKDSFADFLNELSQISTSLSSQIKDYMNSTTNNVNDIKYSTDNIADYLNNYISNQTDNLKESSDKIEEQSNIINDEITTITSTAQKSNDNLNTITNSIVDQFDKISDIVSGFLTVPEFSIEDVSDTINSIPQNGEIRNCTNEGTINGDSNVGGIAGILAKELSNDPEEDILSDAQILVDTTALFRALILQCNNKGNVKAKNECAGGIAGKADVGALCYSANMGSVEVEDGDKCGGIVAAIKGKTVNCYSQGELKANNKVGGIAGISGEKTENCCSMVTINCDGENIGAISGEFNGEYSGNYFVDEGLAGIDGINYNEKAFPLNFEEFKKIEGIPTEFFNFIINFITETDPIKSVAIDYNGSLLDSDIPEIIPKDGYYGEWEEFPRDNIKRSMNIHCVYTPLVTTISNNDEIPNILAEGVFSPNTQITFKENATNTYNIQGYKIKGDYTSEILNNENQLSQNVKIRFRINNIKNPQIAIINNNEPQIIPSSIDGNYIVFDGNNNTRFLVIEKSNMPIYICLAALAVIAITSFTIIKIKKKYNKKKQVENSKLLEFEKVDE